MTWRTRTTAHTTTSKTSSPSSKPRCPACTSGWTSSSDDRSQEPRIQIAVDVPAAPGLARPVRRGDRLRLPVLHRSPALATRQEHQDVARELSDLAVPAGRTGPADKRSATAGLL